MNKNEFIFYIYNKMSEFGTPDINIATKNANILYSIYGNKLSNDDYQIKERLDFILNKVLKANSGV